MQVKDKSLSRFVSYVVEWFRKVFTLRMFVWYTPLILVIPNILLDITEYSSPLVKITNVLLPWSIYILLMSTWKNVGRTALLLFPVMFYGAFQIVLLFLYGGSVIAVDMFLNVATTNISEATELLGSLLPAIFVVVVIYIPVLAWAILLVARRSRLDRNSLRTAFISGIVGFIAACAILGSCYAFVPDYDIVDEVFPVNAVRNTVEAFKRFHDTENYPVTSAKFSYYATSQRPDSVKEVYVMIVGETSRAGNWQLFGYPRPTTPGLSARNDIVGYGRALSESNTTHKSVPLMLSWLTPDNFGDSIYTTKSVTTAFKEAGFSTSFLSNQGRNHSFIEYFAEEADDTEYLPDDGLPHYDMELLTHLSKRVESGPRKQFIILHTYGSHFNYIDRYDSQYGVFEPYEESMADSKNRAQLINSYDNSIRATDALITGVVKTLESLHCNSAMVYVADHGEDLFDDSRGRFLHASPVPTYYQIHVPMVLWMSPELRQLAPGLYEAAVANSSRNVSSSESVFDTLLQLGGLETPYSRPEKSLVSESYREPSRKYVNDHNEGLRLTRVGLRDYDYLKLKELEILVE